MPCHRAASKSRWHQWWHRREISVKPAAGKRVSKPKQFTKNRKRKKSPSCLHTFIWCKQTCVKWHKETYERTDILVYIIFYMFVYIFLWNVDLFTLKVKIISFYLIKWFIFIAILAFTASFCLGFSSANTRFRTQTHVKSPLVPTSSGKNFWQNWKARI